MKPRSLGEHRHGCVERIRRLATLWLTSLVLCLLPHSAAEAADSVARIVRDWQSNRVLYERLVAPDPVPADHKNYLLANATRASAAMHFGNWDLAKTLFDRNLRALKTPGFGAKEGRQSMVLDDDRAIYTGDIHEKVMFCIYRAIIAIEEQAWHQAVGALRMAMTWDAHSTEAEYREDLALVYRLLAMLYLHLGEEANTRFALKQYNRLTEVHSLSESTIREQNVVLLIELGLAPGKREGASFGNMYRVEYPERSVTLAVDDAATISGIQELDLTYQAATRGFTAKDHVQSGKSTLLLLSALLVPPATLLVYPAGASGWLERDFRSWATLPGEIHTIGMTLQPGRHNFLFRFADEHGYRLSRMDRSAYGITVTSADVPRVVLVPSPTGRDVLRTPYRAPGGKKKQSITRFRIFNPPPTAPSEHVAHCFDTTGHRSGATPFFEGGSCYCAPTPEILSDWQEHGNASGLTVQDVAELLQASGFAMPAPDHRRCNGYCSAGPHVALGGKCLVPPTGDTFEYWLIRSGTSVTSNSGDGQ